MSGHGILKYFRLITHKNDTPEDKDPTEWKELPNVSWSIARCNYGAETSETFFY